LSRSRLLARTSPSVAHFTLSRPILQNSSEHNQLN
jgi:hypothetical protein